MADHRWPPTRDLPFRHRTDIPVRAPALATGRAGVLFIRGCRGGAPELRRASHQPGRTVASSSSHHVALAFSAKVLALKSASSHSRPTDQPRDRASPASPMMKFTFAVSRPKKIGGASNPAMVDSNRPHSAASPVKNARPARQATAPACIPVHSPRWSTDSRASIHSGRSSSVAQSKSCDPPLTSRDGEASSRRSSSSAAMPAARSSLSSAA